MKDGIKHDITVVPYTRINKQEFINLASKNDIIHYGNWDTWRHNDLFMAIKKPIIMSVRSHRYNSYVKDVYSWPGIITHTITPLLEKEFPGSVMIPDGIFTDNLPKKEFTVGFAGSPDDYKGFGLIKQACEELGVKFYPAAADIPSDQMINYWPQIDLYVCASLAEGHSTPVMECLYMNKPFISTNVGLPSTLGLPKDCFVDRSVEGIKEGILRHYTNPLTAKYSWDIINKQFQNLYESQRCL